jgi:hypothetical protein
MLVYNKVLAEQAQGAKPVDSEEPDTEDVEP